MLADLAAAKKKPGVKHPLLARTEHAVA
jgi:hypothetical protein